MTASSPQIRKAAVLIRSLDGATAARLLAALSPAEVRAVREAISALGDVDVTEQADVAAELRRAGSAVAGNRQSAVELDPGLFRQPVTAPQSDRGTPPAQPTDPERRLAFLEHADPKELVPLLTGEHPQTVAVVLSLLDAPRAATLLDALPRSCQSEVLKRLAELGDTDPESLMVIERELAAWVARQPKTPRDPSRRGDHAARILAAAEPSARAGLIDGLLRRNRRLAERLGASVGPLPGSCSGEPVGCDESCESHHSLPSQDTAHAASSPITPAANTPPPPVVHRPQPAPSVPFDRLAQLNSVTLSKVVREVDPRVLQLALAGADELLVDRLTERLPKAAARQFRDGLHRLGPTRLSDVAAAQQAVCEVAGRILQTGRPACAPVA